jgi:phosphatidylinositol alpha-1,6-mannosyltransferase
LPLVRDPGSPRLLVATTDFPPIHGGIQRLLHELATRLASRWRITVVAPAADDAREYDDRAPFRVLRTRSDWRGSPVGVLAEMALIVLRTRADLLLAGHINSLPALFAAIPARPKVVLVHGSELWAPRTRLLTRVLGPRVARTMAVSAFTAAEAARAGLRADGIVVTPNGAALAPAPGEREIVEALGLGGGVPFFLTVSRLEAHKGHDVFLRALPAIRAGHPDVVYVIAGTGACAGELARLADRLGVASAVRMLGAVDETTKSALLAACRAFVMVSREQRRPALFEGVGIGYIEAALAGRPALGGASGGISDAVVDGQTGLLVDPCSVPAVTAAALRLLDDPQLADTLGAQARIRARRDYTWEIAVDRMERCLLSVLS